MRRIITCAVAGTAATLLTLGGIGAVAIADDGPSRVQQTTTTPTLPAQAPVQLHTEPNRVDPSVPPRFDDDWDDHHDDWDDHHDDWDDHHDDWDDHHDDWDDHHDDWDDHHDD